MMNVALWVVTALFATGFVAGGITKQVMPYEKYAAKLHWPADFTPGKVKFMGALEALGGLALVIPGLVGVVPGLVPVAASGMALYMSGAITERIRRSEYKELAGDLLFLAAMLFVAWGRFAIEPF
jgi:uncharacterized membrane protein YphA (DoxX/SURF4 family)